MRTILVLIAAAGLPLFAASTSLGTSQEKQDKPAPERPKESRTAYVRRIFEKDRASYGDACRAVTSLVKGEHTDADFAALQKELAEKGTVDAGWELQESSLLTKGTLAYMMVRALSIKGGLTIRLFGLSRRYALRECVHVRLMTGGTTGEYVTGRELIDVLTNAQIYKDEGSLDSQWK